MCMYVRTYVHTSVAGCSEVQCGVPVDLNVTKKRHINFVVILAVVSQGRGGARPRSLEQPGPGAHGYRHGDSG